MDTSEKKELENQLSLKYNATVDFFNKNDFEHFFGDARKTIELIPKYIIFEILQNDMLAEEYILGKKDLEKDSSRNWDFVDKDGDEPQGAFFAVLAKKAIWYKFPYLNSPSKQKHKDLKLILENDLDTLMRFYKIASPAFVHTGKSKLDTITQAKSLATFFEKFYDDFKTVCPKLYSLWNNTFQRFDLSVADNKIQSIWNDLDKLYEDTNHFCSEGGNKFIILLPGDCGKYNSKLVENLFLIPCALIVDFGTHNGNDISSSVDKESWSKKVHPIKEKTDFVVGGLMINWFFSHGEKSAGELITCDFKNWKVSRSKILKDILSNVIKKDKTNHFYILNFLNQPKYAPFIFNMLNEVFGDENSTQNRCDIFSFSKDKETIQGITDWGEDTIVNHFEIQIDFNDFLSYINQKISTNSIDSGNYELNKISFTNEELIYCKEAGIDVFGQSKHEVDTQWDFYSGAEITWKELAADKDVKRTGYERFKQNIIAIINNPKQKTIIYTIKHNPGAGGTTMARRLAFDICKLNTEIEGFMCLPVFLFAYNEKTFDYLLYLSEKKLDNDFLLIIVEGGKVADENVNKLTSRLNARQRNAIVLRVFRTTSANIQGGFNVTTLPSRLNEDDTKAFFEKYSLSYKTSNKTEVLFTQTEMDNGLEVVDFPLKIKDDITSVRLNDYVSAFLNDLPDSLKRFCGYVAFTTYYAGRSLNQQLISNFDSKLIFSDTKIKSSLYKLLLQELDEDGYLSGCWRPRYQSFALPIIMNVWGSDWKLRVNKISIDFIKECAKAGTIGQWDKDMLYGVFILRRGSDFKDSFEDDRTKFAKLIQNVMENEQLPEEIYKALIEVYPDDSIFCGHYGRFLYEQAYAKKVNYSDVLYVDSEKIIRNAIELSPTVDDNYHMLGMLNLRKIQTLHKLVKRIHNAGENDFLDYENLLQKWMSTAKDSFETSIELNPASPYGFTAQCQLYSECIKVGKILKVSEDYSFCDSDPLYMEILDYFSTSLNHLGNICRTYDDNQTYMTKSIRIYDQLVTFHRQVLGNPFEAVKHYRNMYINSSSDNKIYYGRQFVTSLLYARTDGFKGKNRNSIAWAMKHLNRNDRNEISNVLQYLRTQNDFDSFENLFWFRMSSNEEFPLDEAVNLLIEWLRLYEKEGKTGGGKLKALYLLAVCYSAMAINCGSYSEEYVKNAKKYFKLAEELAESFERSALSSYTYMGEEQDAHCILLPNQIEDAKEIEAVICKIDRRKGYVKLPCGLEAFFPANEFNSLADENKTYLRGIIGFRYSGLGLYKFEKVTENTFEQLAEISDRIDEEYEKQKENEVEHGNEFHPEDTEIYRTPEEEKMKKKATTVVGYIDPTLLDRDNSKRQKKQDLIEGDEYEGIIVEPSYGTRNNRIKYVSNHKTYYLLMEGTNVGEFFVDEIVLFKAGKKPDKRDSSKDFWYAYDIRLKEDE